MHFIFSLISFAVVAYAAYWVYTDAEKRGMNAILWALITFFGCFPIGLIIYLIIRKPIGTPAV